MVEREAKMEPPIQTEYFLSGGAMILIFMVEAALMDADDLHAQEDWAEHRLGSSETLVANSHDLTVGQLVGLLDGGGGGGGGHLLLEVESDVAELLLDVTHDLTLSGGHHGVTSLGHDLHEVVGQVASGQVETQDGVGEGETLVDGDGVSHTVTDIQHQTRGTTGGVQGEHGLDTDVHGGVVESLEANLSHLLSVGLRVEGGLGVESGRFIWGDSQLVGEGVMPDLLHVIPVSDDTVLNGVLQGEDTSLGLGLVTDVAVLVAHTDHDSGVFGATDDGREDGAGSVISGEASLAHSGSIVNDQRGGLLVVTHLRLSRRRRNKNENGNMQIGFSCKGWILLSRKPSDLLQGDVSH